MKTNPTPLEIRAARKAAGLTQTQAAKMVDAGLRTWQQWEAGDRKMQLGLWKYFTQSLAMAPFIARKLLDIKSAPTDKPILAYVKSNGFKILTYDTYYGTWGTDKCEIDISEIIGWIPQIKLDIPLD